MFLEKLTNVADGENKDVKDYNWFLDMFKPPKFICFLNSENGGLFGFL